MIWLLVLGAACVGLVQARQDAQAARLALVSIVLLIDLAICHAIEPLEGGCSRVFGAPGGTVAWFLPAAHLAYPVLVTYAIAHLGRAPRLLGVALVLVAVGSCVRDGAAWSDVAGGIALGKLIGWATFDHEALRERWRWQSATLC